MKILLVLIRSWTVRFMYAGTLLILIGSGLNRQVVLVNDNVMPVATTRSEILFVIGDDRYLTDYRMTDKLGDGFRAMTSTDKLSFLSDRIFIIPSEAGVFLEKICSPLNLGKLCPLHRSLRMASIGDLLIWAGIPFVGLALILLELILLKQFFFYVIRKPKTTNQ